MLIKKNLNHRNILSIVAVALLVIFFSLWIINLFKQKQNIPIQSIPQEAQQATQTLSGIASVVDGDSIRVNNQKTEIRLLGIDAPEMKQKCLDKNYDEYKCGEVSKEFLTKLIAGKQIICYSTGHDIYQRYLAYCFLAAQNINEEILKNGMAIIYDLNSASDELKAIEQQARNAKLGIWQGGFLEPKLYRKKNKNKKNKEK